MVQTVCNIENIGKQQYEFYRQALLVHGTKTIHDPIKRNSLRLSRNPTSNSKRSDKSRELKEDVSLFSHLYIASKAVSYLGSFFIMRIIHIHHLSMTKVPFGLEQRVT